MPALKEKPEKTQRPSVSLRRILAALASLLIPIMLLGPSFLLISFERAREAAGSRLSATVEAQMEDMNDALASASFYLTDTMMNSSLPAAMNTEDVHERNVAARELYNEMSLHTASRKGDFCFFFYYPAWDLKVNCYDKALHYEDCVKLGNYARIRASGGNWANSPQWTPLLVDGRVYLFQMYSINGYHLAGWVSCQSLFSFLEKSILSDEGSYTVIDREGHPMPDTEEARVWLDQADQKRAHASKAFCKVFETYRAEMSLLVVDESYLDLEFPLLALIFSMVVFIIVLGFSLYTFFYFQRYIEQPFRQFQEHIQDYAAEKHTARERGFAELNEAVNAFDSLKRQLEELKIDVYEERLALARTELEYFQLQIKPHFFVNCFSILFGMAQKQDYKRIQEFCLKLSNYVRYLFRDGLGTVPLSEELAMLREYLDIQDIRHHTETIMEDRVDPDLLSARIPPLLLLSFAENSVKHGEVEGRQLCVSLRVSTRKVESDEEMLVLTMRDNGKGYLPESLPELNALAADPGLPRSNSGRHIGARNICKRLALLYGSRYSVSFSNEEGHARMEITLPLQKTNPVQEEDT